MNLQKQHDNVKILGFVNDPYSIIKSSICTIAPMQSGGGLQTKILMAMALESIVVATSLPTKAIESAINNFNVIIEDDAFKFSQIINSLYQFPEVYNHIKKNAKKLIIDNYSHQVINTKLNNIIFKYFK